LQKLRCPVRLRGRLGKQEIPNERALRRTRPRAFGRLAGGTGGRGSRALHLL